MTAAKRRERGALGTMLRALRTERRWSQEDLAARTRGVSKSHIGLIETGRIGGKREKIEALAEALGATTEQHRQLLEAAGYGGDVEESTADLLAALADRLTALEQQVGKPDGGRPVMDRLAILEERLAEGKRGRDPK